MHAMSAHQRRARTRTPRGSASKQCNRTVAEKEGRGHDRRLHRLDRLQHYAPFAPYEHARGAAAGAALHVSDGEQGRGGAREEPLRVGKGAGRAGSPHRVCNAPPLLARRREQQLVRLELLQTINRTS